MTVDLIKFAFIGGEVAPTYYGRSDLEKFDLSLEECENWFIDYLGGLSTQPGLEWIDYVENDDKATKFFTFKFASNAANTYVLLFGDGYIRFIQDGAYVVEGRKRIGDITLSTFPTVTSYNHGYHDGDWIKFPVTGEMVELANLTAKIVNVTDNTYKLEDTFGNHLDTSDFTALTTFARSARIYTIHSPFAVEDLDTLSISQTRDTLRLTHADYKTYNLVRHGHTDWELEIEPFSTGQSYPTGLTGTPLMVGNDQGSGYAVTSVNHDNEESPPSDMKFVTNIEHDANSLWGVTLNWTPVDDTNFYRVYATRSVINPTTLSKSYQLGYIGQTKGAHFVDTGIIPDFTQTPPQVRNPFADGQITNIDVTAGGAGFSNSSVISVTDPNPLAGGFRGAVIVQTSSGSGDGPIAGIIILDAGHNYTSPVFAVTGGAGETLEATVSESSGNNPATSAVFQQRQVYAATANNPLDFIGSRIGQLSNFNISDILVANDSYDHELDSDDVSPIRHLVPVRGGLLIFNAANVWLAYGSQGSITATNVQADVQDAPGASVVRPLKIDGSVIYCDATGSRVISLAYTDPLKLYSGNDLSIIANHLLSEDKQITAWGYAATPFKTVWARRQDGVILCLTIIQEQKVLAWSRRTTRGEFMDLTTLQEGTSTSTYVMSRRYVNGRWTKFIERVARRDFTHDEDSICLDCCLKLAVSHPHADLQVASVSGTGVQASISDTLFTVDDVGKIIRSGGGKMRVTAFVDAETVTVNIIRPITQVVPNMEDDLPAQTHYGDWTLDTEVTIISGLWHLNNEEVTVVADGNVIKGLTVRSGFITLPRAASRVVVGWKYRCKAKPLPLNVPGAVTENKRKRIIGLALRVKDTRGLSVGMDLDDLQGIKERGNELYSEPNTPRNGMDHVSIGSFWEDEAAPYIVQDEPLPATLLGYVAEAELGDDP